MLGFSSFSGYPGSNREEELFAPMRLRMVEDQIHTRGVRDERTLKVLRKVPRHEFIPDEEKPKAYSDGPLAIGYGQTISQPDIVGLMTELLQVRPTDKVLEIGTGSGYQAAVLAELAGELYTIEIVEPLYERTKQIFEKSGYRSIHIRLGDGTKGWPEAAPFDRIMVTAAGLKIPDSLIQQLKEGGRVVMPVGETEQILIVGEKRNHVLKIQESIPVRFVPLIEKPQGDDDGPKDP